MDNKQFLKDLLEYTLKDNVEVLNVTIINDTKDISTNNMWIQHYHSGIREIRIELNDVQMHKESLDRIDWNT